MVHRFFKVESFLRFSNQQNKLALTLTFNKRAEIPENRASPANRARSPFLESRDNFSGPESYFMSALFT